MCNSCNHDHGHAHGAAVSEVDEALNKLETVATEASESVFCITVISDAGMTTGTCGCVDERGYFLTAAHVGRGAQTAFIVDDGMVAVKLVAVDEDNDLALFVLEAPGRVYKKLEFGDLPNRNTVVGGIGFPAHDLGMQMNAYPAMYAGRFERGIIREFPGVRCKELPNAACFIGGGLNLPGYSGGPLLGLDGKVVAITCKGDGDNFVAATSGGVARQFVQQHVPA